ncbi:DNA-binding protein [Acinetobacter phage vB_AP_P1489]|uniref:DNA-binding protein n=1 Tax=Acinetobacter phage vB_AP_P1489 TaxID=3032263 RepID=A0AA49ICX4_9CAUD|nr:DNA-binding protein [Acinetobacter phage vB_AP_P1489]
MKFGKVKVGMRVRVALNQKGNSFEYACRGRVGTVIEKESVEYNHKIGNYRPKFSVRVQFDDGSKDWGSALNLEEVKDEA